MQRYFSMLFILILIFSVGCSAPQASPSIPVIMEQSEPKAENTASYKTISAEEAHVMMTAEHILLDVRTDEEFREGHISGAILIPDYEIAVRAESELPDKAAIILVYCRSGRRSALAAQELADIGYSNIFDFGGIIDWPYEIITGD